MVIFVQFVCHIHIFIMFCKVGAKRQWQYVFLLSCTVLNHVFCFFSMNWLNNSCKLTVKMATSRQIDFCTIDFLGVNNIFFRTSRLPHEPGASVSSCGAMYINSIMGGCALAQLTAAPSVISLVRVTITENKVTLLPNHIVNWRVLYIIIYKKP